MGCCVGTCTVAHEMRHSALSAPAFVLLPFATRPEDEVGRAYICQRVIRKVFIMAPGCARCFCLVTERGGVHHVHSKADDRKYKA